MRARLVGVDGAQDLAACHALALPKGQAWDAAAFERYLTAGAVGALSEDGAGLVLAWPQGTEAEILLVSTAAETRGAGVATGLLAQMLSELAAVGVESVFLEVAADNAPALALYVRAGFVEIGRRPGYYPRAEGAMDALLMRRRLP